MIERRNSFGFPNKALHTLRVSSNFCGQHLDRHSALQLGRVLREIHLAHPAPANLRADFIAADFCADGEGHFRWVILWLQSPLPWARRYQCRTLPTRVALPSIQSR